MPVNNSGLFSALGAFILFGFMPLYVQIFTGQSGYVLIGQRIIFSFFLISLMLLLLGKFRVYLRPLMQPKQWLGLALGSILIGLQWGLFVWAPVNGHTLDLSLGYILMPMMMTLIGRFFLKETLHPLQWGATVLAAMGVATFYYQASGLSWVSWLVIIGYPCYLLLRRFQKLPTLTAFLIENTLLLPLAIFLTVQYSTAKHIFDFEHTEILAFIGLALMGSVPMLLFIAASRRLPMTVFALLSYIEPLVIFLVAYFILHEPLHDNELISYWLIFAALLVLATDTSLRMRAKA